MYNSDDRSDGYCGRRNTEYPAPSNASVSRDGVHLKEFMYLKMIGEPGDSYRARFSLCCRVSGYVCDGC